MYVYEANSPHNLKALFPVDGEVRDVVISDDDTIVVSDLNNMLILYVYDGHSMWHMGETLKLEPLEHYGYEFLNAALTSGVFIDDFIIFHCNALVIGLCNEYFNDEFEV